MKTPKSLSPLQCTCLAWSWLASNQYESWAVRTESDHTLKQRDVWLCSGIPNFYTRITKLWCNPTGDQLNSMLFWVFFAPIARYPMVQGQDGQLWVKKSQGKGLQKVIQLVCCFIPLRKKRVQKEELQFPWDIFTDQLLQTEKKIHYHPTEYLPVDAAKLILKNMDGAANTWSLMAHGIRSGTLPHVMLVVRASM